MNLNYSCTVISTDEDPSLWIERFGIINLRGVSTKLYFNICIIVFFSVKPKISVNCSNITLNKGAYFACQCNGTDGYPIANVTWYKDMTQIEDTGIGNATLVFSNATEDDNGTYRCEVKSGTVKADKVEIIDIRVKRKYN